MPSVYYHNQRMVVTIVTILKTVLLPYSTIYKTKLQTPNKITNINKLRLLEITYVIIILHIMSSRSQIARESHICVREYGKL